MSTVICERGSRDARDATTRPSSLGSDGSSMAISADQTEGKRMQRRAKAAMRNAMSMTNIARDGRGKVVVDERKKDKKGKNELPHAEPCNRLLCNHAHCGNSVLAYRPSTATRYRYRNCPRSASHPRTPSVHPPRFEG